MLNYILQRIILALLTMFGILVLVFIVIRIVPGDSAQLLAGFEARPEDVQALRHKFGTDQPIFVQFIRYLEALGRGDLGESTMNSRPVISEITPAIINTVQLVFMTMLLTSCLGVFAGVVAASRQNSVIDRLIIIMSIIGICTPSFFLALLLILVFAIWLHWFPAIGIGGLEHLVLPSLTLTAASVGITVRMTRASLLDVLSTDYIRTAYAKGLNSRSVILRHALPNSFISILTVIGLQASYLLGGAALVETIFAYPGIGWLLVDAIQSRDYPIVQAAVLFISFTTVLVNLLIDILYVLFDPRIRLQT